MSDGTADMHGLSTTYPFALIVLLLRKRASTGNKWQGTLGHDIPVYHSISAIIITIMYCLEREAKL